MQSNLYQIMSHATQRVFHQSSKMKIPTIQLYSSQSKQKTRHLNHAPSSLMLRKRHMSKLIPHRCSKHSIQLSNNHTVTILSLSIPIIQLATTKTSCITLSNGTQIKCTWTHQTTFRRKPKTFMLMITLQRLILANITSKIIASGPSSSANSVNKISESKRKINKSNNT